MTIGSSKTKKTFSIRWGNDENYKKRPFELLSKASKKALSKELLKVPIEEFSHEIIRTVDGKFKTVLKVIDPLNVSIIDKKGIGKAIKHTQSALNALNPGERCQMLIISDEVDISQYVRIQKKKYKKTAINHLLQTIKIP